MQSLNYVARAINNDMIDIDSAKCTYLKNINLTSNQTQIEIPYLPGLTWTSMEFIWPTSSKYPLEISIGTTNAPICSINCISNTMYHFRWPIPSINSDDPLTVTISYSDASDLPADNIQFTILGFAGLLPIAMYYVMFDENSKAIIDIRNTSASSKPKGYHLFMPGEHITCVEDYEIYPTSVYVSNYERELNYDSDSE
jgi:hypothetical protein